jgi:hypothetical protein
MVSRLKFSAQDLQVATRGLAPDAIAAELAKFAKEELAAVIGSGEGSPLYDRFVNGREGAPEDSVIPPGPIVYQFSWWPEIIAFALETLVKRSPERSGRFKKSWFAMVNGEPVTDFDSIPIDAQVTITNDQPYARKIEVGHMTMSVPPGVAEDARQIVQRVYGALIKVQKTMITLPGGYILKGVFTKGVRQFARKGLQKDTQAGQPVTYPALVLNFKDI